MTNNISPVLVNDLNLLKCSVVEPQKKIKPVVVLLTSCPIFAAIAEFYPQFFRSIAAMIPCKTFAKKLTPPLLPFLLFFVANIHAQDGKTLFISKCASCHAMDRVIVGPALQGAVDRWGGDKAMLKEWIRNSEKLIKSGNIRAQEISTFSPTAMTAFDIPDAEITAIIDYIEKWTPPVVVVDPDSNSKTGSSQGAILFGIISLIMAIIAMILMQVNSNLRKLSADSEGAHHPEPVPFYKNKTYIALFSVVLFIVGGFYVTKGAIGLGRQKDRQPVQPIYYSHKVHAGINQINCLYCHGAAMESKHAAIPSTNVCMNCHKAITSYEKGPKLYDENGEEINGTAEIEKLYKYAGFDPKNPTAWNPSKADSIPWEKIHNLPDHVYFNHSQHVKVGKVQCQSCHGEITRMDEVYQFSELSMGWCINCHRQTKVDFYDKDKGTGNKFYSIYEKFHNDIKSGKMDSVTVKDIGGMECQKCHY